MRLTSSVRGILLAVGALACIVAAYAAIARSGLFQLDRQALIAKYADSESKFVQIRGIEVHYKDEGQGPALLLLHGSFGSLRTWDGVVDSLKEEFRLIRLDQPPSALSGDIPAGAKNLQLEDFVRLFLDAVEVRHAMLVGTSSGGIIAYRFAAKYPDRTSGLVIANSPSAVVDNSAIATPPALKVMSYLSARVLKHRPKLYWRLLLESLYANPTRLSADIVEQYSDMGRKNSALSPNSSMYARVNDNDEIDEVLRSVRAPTLLLWGVPDPVLPEAMAYQLQSKLTSAQTEVVILKGTGHYPPVESPALVAEQIKRFHAALPPDGPIR